MLTERLLRTRLRRPLRGQDSPTCPTCEYGVLAAIRAHQVDRVRDALADPAAAGIGDDFAGLVARLLAVKERPASGGDTACKRYEVDVPLPLWHQMAHQARVQARPIREVLRDYLLRGWDDARQSRDEAINARRALREDLAAVRSECQALRAVVLDLSGRVSAGNPRRT